MPTPTPVLNARERLIKSIEHWISVINDGKPAGGPQVAAAVAADLFGDPAPDITPAPGRSSHIGPVGQLAMWFALVCEELGIMQPGAQAPPGIMVDLKLLIPLLSLHPTTFEDQLYHEFVFMALDRGAAICKTCDRMMRDHFLAAEKLHMAEIESLRSDIEIMEATTDIQMQAIAKQIEEINSLTGKKKLADPETCPHPSWSSSTDEPLHCNECGKLLDKVPYGSGKAVDLANCQHRVKYGGTTCQDCGKTLVDPGRMSSYRP